MTDMPTLSQSGMSSLHLDASQECTVEANSVFLNNGRLSLLDQEVRSSRHGCVLYLTPQ